jgi:hypothetical protein
MSIWLRVSRFVLVTAASLPRLLRTNCASRTELPSLATNRQIGAAANSSPALPCPLQGLLLLRLSAATSVRPEAI